MACRTEALCAVCLQGPGMTERPANLKRLLGGALALLAVAGVTACQSTSPGVATTVSVRDEERLLQDRETLLQDYAGGAAASEMLAASYGEAAEATDADVMVFVRQKVTGDADQWPFVALDDPKFIAADSADFLAPESLVLGLSIGGEAKAYPTAMMWFHHVANDTIGGQSVAVTY